MLGNSAVIATAVATVGSLTDHNQPRLPALDTTRRATPLVLPAPTGMLKTLDSISAAAPSVPSKPLPSRAGSPMQPGSIQSIYGTSANNAYKVYFPQIEPPAAGTNSERLESFSEAPEQDGRVLKKSGSYLFYGSPSDSEVGQNIEASLNDDGGVDAEALARAVAKLGKKAEKHQLTEPALQKKPLDFGQGLFKAAELPENAPAAPEGGADVEQ